MAWSQGTGCLSSLLLEYRGKRLPLHYQDSSTSWVLEIFELLPDNHAVAALDSSARKFYRFWRSDAAAISDNLLPRSIDSYDSAEGLSRVPKRHKERDWEVKEPETDIPKPHETQ